VFHEAKRGEADFSEVNSKRGEARYDHHEAKRGEFVKYCLVSGSEIYRRKSAVALEDYEDGLENYLRALPSDHVDIARVYTDMVRSCEQLPNELEKALEYTKKAADIFEKTLPREHTANITICMATHRIKNKLRLQN
jgi:tetratricopeptide (TPR) repeat protein